MYLGRRVGIISWGGGVVLRISRALEVTGAAWEALWEGWNGLVVAGALLTLGPTVGSFCPKREVEWMTPLAP